MHQLDLMSLMNTMHFFGQSFNVQHQMVGDITSKSCLLQSDFENASMGSPTPGPPSASQGAARKNTLRLRAETDDENDSHVADARPTSKKRQLPRYG